MWSTQLEAVGVDTSHSGGTFIVGSGTANTKGSYVELDASTAFTVSWFMAQFGHQSELFTGEALIDIATGAGGAEVVLIANIGLTFYLGNVPSSRPGLLIPVAISSGTRVSARCQISITSVVNIITILLLIAESSISGSSVADTYGANTADSSGTEIDPGGTANTKGSYVEITGSSSNDHNWLALIIQNGANVARTDSSFLLDIATGAAGAETVVIPDLWFAIDASNDVFITGIWSIGVNDISSGTRIAARAQAQTNDAADRLFDLMIIGFDVALPAGGEASHVF